MTPTNGKIDGSDVLRLPASGLLLGFAVTACGAPGEDPGLQFEPEQPRPGSRIEVSYRPDANLAGEDRVRLRARFRTPSDDANNDDQTHTVVDTLAADGSGAFRGSFVLPDSVVYGVFAVESLSGGVVDSNDRKLWELLVHGTDGRPLLAALDQRQNDLMGRNWPLAHEIASRATELYPDSVAAWSGLEFFQSALFGEATADSIRAFHRKKFRQFDDRYRNREEVTGEVASVMMWYARSVDDSTAADRWRKRLLVRAPDHPLAVQERANRLFRRHYDRYEPGERPALLLTEFEELWQEVGSAHSYLLLWGWRTARRTGDPENIRRWGDRRIEKEPSLVGYVARAYAEVPQLRDRGIELLGQHVERLRWQPDADRRLHQTVADHRLATRDELARGRVALAEALLSSGDSSRAHRHVEEAISDIWDTEVFRRAADLNMRLGDTVAAAELWARVAADPNSSQAFEDSARSRIGGSIPDSAWQAWKLEGRTVMRDRVVETAVRRPVEDSARLLTSGRDTVRLGDLLLDGSSVVVFWSRYCGPSLQQLPSLQDFYEGLSEDASVDVVAVTDESPSEELRAFLEEEGLTVPVYHDLWGEAGRAFNQWGTPQYFVVDGEARIRFEYTQLPDIPRQLQVVRGL